MDERIPDGGPTPDVRGIVRRLVGVAEGGGPAAEAGQADAQGQPGDDAGMRGAGRALGITREEELEREVAELRRANRRLSGALTVVLDTLDSEDVGSLFQRVLEEMTTTMGADGTLCYLAEPDGFHLRGFSEGLADARAARFMPYGRALESLVTREGHAMRLSVLPPGRDDLRRGALSEREVADEESGERARIPAVYVPPFSSFFAVPVWFGEGVIAIIEVGWARARHLREDDARLLDSLAQYLSVQLVSAFAEQRRRRADELRAAETEVREALLSAAGAGSDGTDAAGNDVLPDGATVVGDSGGGESGGGDPGSGESGREDQGADDADAADAPRGMGRAVMLVAEALDAHALRVSTGADGLLRVSSSLGGDGSKGTSLRAAPFSLETLEVGVDAQRGAVVPVGPSEGLGAWLLAEGLPCRGALVDFGELSGGRGGLLFLRERESEPLDSAELSFLRTFVEDVRGLEAGVRERQSTRHISQALQQGMRNSLQQVEGISAEASYTSATASALVGGDFYDLVRLAGRRACVILGDVSGKGVEAASVSAAVKTALRAYAWEGLSPARMVRNLNEFLLGFSRPETFCTLFVGVVDLGRGVLTYCSAGHPPALIVRAPGSRIEQLSVQSGVVGALDDMTYRDGEVRLGRGDLLLLYTDGTTEARTPEGAFLGEEGLRSLLAREVAGGFEGLVERILAFLYRYTGNHLVDDVALVALRFDEVGTDRAGGAHVAD